MFIKSIFIKEGMTYLEIAADENPNHAESLKMSEKNWRKYCERYVPDALSNELYERALSHEIDEAEYDELHRLAELTGAILEAVRILSSGDKSARELKQKLRRRFSSEAADYAVRLMKKRGYLDEEAQCLRIAEQAVRSKHHGPRRIQADLMAHGYSSSAADAAVSAISPDKYAEALSYHIDRRFPDIANMDAAEVKKVVAALLRLGFSSGAVFDEIKKREKVR